MKKVSVYIPTFNSGKYIEECLKSVFSQKHKFSEVIIIDNNSSDDTVKIALGFNVKIKIIKNRKGLAYARNVAIKIAKYPYLASIDSDVILDKDWTHNIMKNFDKKNIGGVNGKLIENDSSYTAKWRKHHMNQNWGKKRIINPEFLFGSNCVFVKSTLKKVGGYNNEYKTNYEDVDISKKVKNKGYDLIYDPKSICLHRKKDTIITLIKSYYRWTFYGYHIPNNFGRFLFRFFITNPYKSLSLLKKDLISANFQNVPLDILMGAMHSLFDLNYLIKNE